MSLITKISQLILPLYCLSFVVFSAAAAELPAGYTQLSAEEKLSTLNSLIYSSKYQELPTTYPLSSSWKLLIPDYVATTLDHASDEMPEGRLKLIHTYGTVAPVKFVITQNNHYTGLFKSGAEGLLRASLAHPFPSYTPGFALKFLIDGKKSVNVFAMDSLEGQGDNRNFFAKPFKTKIDLPSSAHLKVLMLFFDKAMQRYNPQGSSVHLPLDHMASVNKDGSKVARPVYPDSLVFVPAVKGFLPTSKEDVRSQLERLFSNRTLYYVFAEDKKGRTMIGKLVQDGDFISSEFGDKNLFFEHHPGGSKSSTGGDR
jgi:hypothetical protein